MSARTAEPIGKIADVGIDQHKTAFDVNLFSQLDLARLALPKLRAAKGRIVATTSGIVGFPLGGWAAYCRYAMLITNVLILAVLLAVQRPR